MKIIKSSESKCCENCEDYKPCLGHCKQIQHGICETENCPGLNCLDFIKDSKK